MAYAGSIRHGGRQAGIGNGGTKRSPGVGFRQEERGVDGGLQPVELAHGGVAPITYTSAAIVSITPNLNILLGPWNGQCVEATMGHRTG
ncbi:hypothetical protein D3C84_1016180 [compost metagenome]